MVLALLMVTVSDAEVPVVHGMACLLEMLSYQYTG
jgi:hypothetical protein